MYTELRNRIYEFCLSEEVVPLVPKRKFLHVGVPSQLHLGVLALAHMNRQVRKEFLPIYKRNMNVGVPFRDIQEFADTWLSGEAQLAGNIHILDYQWISRTSAEVHSLLRACSINPGLTVAPRSVRVVVDLYGHPSYRYELRGPWNLYNLVQGTRHADYTDNTWLNYFERAVTAITVSSGLEDAVIQVKKEYVEPWMTEHMMPFQYAQQWQAWQQRVQLPGSWDCLPMVDWSYCRSRVTTQADDGSAVEIRCTSQHGRRIRQLSYNLD
ncbi:hypothetical protein DPSP01_005140 [Paraphaeosphaeria sporulosa]